MISETEEATITPENLTGYKPVESTQLGRKAGLDHQKSINIEQFMVEHGCLNMLIDHVWLKSLKLISNPYMYRTYGKANYKTYTVELSDKLKDQPTDIQREVFIRTACHFIAKKLFGETGDGQGFKLLVSRYLRKDKGQSNSTGAVTRNAVKQPELEEA